MMPKEYNRNNMSFLPEDYIQKRVERRTNLICLSLFGVVLIGVVGAYVVTNGQRMQVLKDQKQINAQYAEAAKSLAQLTELQQRRKQLLSKAQVTATLIEPVPRSNLLAELINRMPGTVTLTECKLASKKLAAPKPKPVAAASALANAKQAAEQKQQAKAAPAAPRYLVTITMEGLAPTDIQVAQYMTELARCELLDEVDLAYSEAERVDDITMREFKVVMTLDEAADVRLIEPLLAPGDGNDREVEPAIKRNVFGRTRLQASVPTQETGE